MYGRKTVTVAGTFTARPGDIIEIRTGGSWNNDYRDWFIAGADGGLRRVCSADSSAGKLSVERYLKNEIGMDALNEDKTPRYISVEAAEAQED